MIRGVFLFLFLVFNFSSVDAAGIFSDLQESAGAEECWEAFSPGTKVWGTYTCSSCNIQTSAKPNDEKRQVCVGCGKPHQSEPYIAPETREGPSGYEVLISRGSASHTRVGSKSLADKGKPWPCSYCESSNLATEESCGGCNTPRSMSERRTRDLAKTIATEFRSTTVVSEGNFAALVEVAGPQVKRLKKKVRSMSIASLIGLASIAPVTGGGGYVYWGMQTFEAPGFVTEIGSKEIEIEYRLPESNPQKIVIVKSQNGDKWRVGEPVTLFLRNWSGPQGAERSNGEAFPVPQD